MSGPTTAREALLAELLGDIQKLLDHTSQLQHGLATADASARETAEALRKANAEYRDQVDHTLARMRVEVASLLSKTAERTVSDLAGRQTEILQRAAVTAVRQALSAEAVRRTRADWIRMFAAGGGAGAATALAVAGALRLLGVS